MPTLPGRPQPDPDPLDEHIVNRTTIQESHYLAYQIVTVERSDGSRAERDVVVHPGAVAMIALDADGRIALVRQYRVAAERTLLELPAGTLDVNDGVIEDPAEAAARELEEETGYRAGTWERLASFWTAPGFATELMHLYLATDLSPVGEDRLGPAEDERLDLVWMPWQAAVAAAETGEIADAKSILGLLWLARRLGQAAS